MKTNVMKRAMALILAALIVLGTLGYLWTVAFAKEGDELTAGEKGKYTVKYTYTKNAGTSGEIKNEDQVSFTLTITPTSTDSLKGADTVAIHDTSDFDTQATGTECTIKEENGYYTVKLNGLVYHNPNATEEGSLVFVVQKESQELDKFTIPISECKTDSGDGGDGNDDGNNDTPLPSNMTYTLTKVYASSSSNPS